MTKLESESVEVYDLFEKQQNWSLKNWNIIAFDPMKTILQELEPGDLETPTNHKALN